MKNPFTSDVRTYLSCFFEKNALAKNNYRKPKGLRRAEEKVTIAGDV